MKLSITPTLLNSLDWYNDCPPSWKDKAYADLEATIKRLPKEFGEAAKKGVDFENAVQAVCERGCGNDKGSEGFRKVVEHCSGGVFQQWCQYYFKYDDIMIRAYGKIDVTLPEKIIDIKTTGKFKGALSYLKGWQPAVYLLATGKPVFEFIVAEWESAASTKVKTVHPPIVCKAGEDMESKLVAQYHKFTQFLQNNNLYEDYVYTFCKNPRQ